MWKRLKEDIDVIKQRDPAARHVVEICLCYPGLHALLVYRLSHWLWNLGLKLIARMLSYAVRIITSIEIHPAATIGHRVFIDHGVGVVIGETAIIEDDVTIYHGVTLGGVSPINERANTKRHPHVKANVIIGSGAQLLGAITIGANARIGSNAVVLKDVEDGQLMVGVPAHRTSAQQPAGSATDAAPFMAYAAPDRDCEEYDPIQQQLAELQQQVIALKSRLDGDSATGLEQFYEASGSGI